MPIRILADEVASQIAAGEVVERPASVVKELVENALDAGATLIEVQIEQAGRALIEVSDDGAGIPSEEMPLAVARHATSKLRTADDLFHIRSLGFRGEALASVGSVARMVVISRNRDSELGGKLVVEAGKSSGVEKVGVPVGTVITVENLFYNVPARLKFLKTDMTERNLIHQLVTRYAIAYPDIRFRLISEGKQALQTNGSGNRREVFGQLYGPDMARQMLEVSFQDGSMRVEGLISPVGLTRSNRKEMTFFVNGRWVQDSALSSALMQAYHTLLMVGRYPLVVLFVELDAEDVDVNVHPAKAEVRFRKPDMVFSGVQRAVRRALMAYSPAPQLSTPYWQSQPSQGRMIDPAWEMAGQSGSGLNRDGADETGRDKEGEERGLMPPVGQIPLLRVIGQVGAAYLVAEGPDGLYLIDQHAAHERVLFERFIQQRSQRIASQQLLEAVAIQLTPGQSMLLSTQLETLNKLGFEVEEFGGHTFRIRAIPALLTGSDPAAAVRVVVEDFEEDETPLKTEIEERLIARICKRAAVKAGKSLSADEQRALVRDLEGCQSPRTCPHGRPTMIHLSVDLLERQFGRRGSR